MAHDARKRCGEAGRLQRAEIGRRVGFTQAPNRGDEEACATGQDPGKRRPPAAELHECDTEQRRDQRSEREHSDRQRHRARQVFATVAIAQNRARHHDTAGAAKSLDGAAGQQDLDRWGEHPDKAARQEQNEPHLDDGTAAEAIRGDTKHRLANARGDQISRDNSLHPLEAGREIGFDPPEGG